MLIRALALLFAFVIVPSHLAAQGFCIAPDDTGQVLLEGVQQLTSRTETPYVKAREQMNVPFTAESEVTYVTDEAVCERVAQAIASNAQRAGFTPSNRVRVIRIGSQMFVAKDPAVEIFGNVLTYHLTKAYKVMDRYR